MTVPADSMADRVKRLGAEKPGAGVAVVSGMAPVVAGVHVRAVFWSDHTPSVQVCVVLPLTKSCVQDNVTVVPDEYIAFEGAFVDEARTKLGL